MSKLFKVVLLINAIVINFGAKLPDQVGRCSISSPEIKQCLSKNIQEAIIFFKNGNPQMGLPSLDPLKVPSLVIGEGTGPVNVVQNFSNVMLYGFTDATMNVKTADLNKGLIEAETVTKRIEMLADYTVDGRILVLPVKGSGKCNITIIKAKTTHVIEGEKIEKNGKIYFHLKDYRVEMEPERMFYHFENLFDGDERMGAEINKVMNENWKEVYADVKLGYDKTYGMIFLGLANSLFSRVTFDDIFLP
nr:protein takeout-like [Onthophagus taurus]